MPKPRLRTGAHRTDNLYLQYGPTPTKQDLPVATARNEDLARELVQAYNAHLNTTRISELLHELTQHPDLHQCPPLIREHVSALLALTDPIEPTHVEVELTVTLTPLAAIKLLSDSLAAHPTLDRQVMSLSATLDQEQTHVSLTVATTHPPSQVETLLDPVLQHLPITHISLTQDHR